VISRYEFAGSDEKCFPALTKEHYVPMKPTYPSTVCTFSSHAYLRFVRRALGAGLEDQEERQMVIGFVNFLPLSKTRGFFTIRRHPVNS
jgi:hypothetical protein